MNMKHHVDTFDVVAHRLADRFDGLLASGDADGSPSAVIDIQDYFMRCGTHPERATRCMRVRCTCTSR